MQPQSTPPTSSNGVRPDTSRTSERTCVGCRQVGSPAELFRVTEIGDQLAVDLAGKSWGRGAWLHPDLACIGKACRGGLGRALRSERKHAPGAIVARLKAVADARVAALIGVAFAARKLRVGVRASREALADKTGLFAVMASNPGAGNDFEWLSPWVVSGQLRVWGTQVTLGRTLGRPETLMIAVTDQGLARALGHAITCANVPRPDLEGRVDGASVEDR